MRAPAKPAAPPEVLAEVRWRLTEQDYQREPEGDWHIWLFLAGRNSGKTYTGANWVRRQVQRHPGKDGGVIARTHRDLVDTCIEGPSGLLRILPEGTFDYRPSKNAIYLSNGATIHTYSAEKPDSMRGPNLAWAWCDELAAWDYADEAWEQLMMATRVGRPQIFISTTPRPKDLILSLVQDSKRDPSVHVRAASSYQNKFTSQVWRDFVREKYEGTRLGRQELYAELLTDVEGALWTWDMLDACAVREAPQLKRVVVGVDPSGGRTETGIVVAGVARDGVGYVLADMTCGGSPETWAKAVASAYHGWSADRVAVETNFGGAMAEHTLRTHDQSLPIKVLTASKGKIPRAEPVSALYEQGKVHHVGRFPDLEKQMCTWTADDRKSPDRMDALVWALTELMVTGRSVADVGPVSMTKDSYWR